jgi:hypothetical protein
LRAEWVSLRRDRVLSQGEQGPLEVDRDL